MATLVLALAAASIVVVALQVSCFFSYDASRRGENEQKTPVAAKAATC